MIIVNQKSVIALEFTIISSNTFINPVYVYVHLKIVKKKVVKKLFWEKGSCRKVNIIDIFQH